MNIRRARKNQGISQQQLGFEAGLSRELVSQLESGKTNVTHDTLHAIAVVLDVGMKELFDF